MAKTNAEMNSQMPFAVVGSTDFVRVGNKVKKLDTTISKCFSNLNYLFHFTDRDGNRGFYVANG